MKEQKPMELLQLRYFQAVARRDHVSRAAADLQVAQPSLSRTIARLEHELGVPLFDRVGRRVRLNRFGAALLTHVDRALRELDDARRELADEAGADAGSVAVAAETLLGVTALLAEFRAAHPRIQFRLYQSTPPAMAAQLASGEVEYCLASQPVAGPGLATAELLTEEVLLAVPAGHRLAGRERVTVAEIAAEPFVITRSGHWQRALLDRLLADAGHVPVVACEGDEPGAIRGLVAAGIGVSLLPLAALAAAVDPRIGWVHLDAPAAKRTLRLVWRTDAYRSAAARRFRDFAVQRLREAGTV
jgi:DNA-binding transcriptional LysR family regulator